MAGFYVAFNAQADRSVPCLSVASVMRRSWSKSSVSQSEAVRQYAVQQLAGDAYQDGAFLLRDSTSRAGCFALSLKFHGDVTHYLIEVNANGKVQVKDATSAFPNIAALICHHCMEADGGPADQCPHPASCMAGLPCTLRPDQCLISSNRCPYVSMEWFEEQKAKLQAGARTPPRLPHPLAPIILIEGLLARHGALLTPSRAVGVAVARHAAQHLVSVGRGRHAALAAVVLSGL